MTTPDLPHWNPKASLPPAPPDRGNWAIGAAFAFGCILLVIPLAVVVTVVASELGAKGEAQMSWLFAPLILFGLSQWLFVLPLGLFLHYRGKVDTAMGLWISAGVMTLLNGACFGLMWAL